MFFTSICMIRLKKLSLYITNVVSRLDKPYVLIYIVNTR